MGYAENKKLAKDINDNTTHCAFKFQSALNAVRDDIDVMNHFLETISQNCPTKDYVDAGDAVVIDEVDNILSSLQNRRYEAPSGVKLDTICTFINDMTDMDDVFVDRDTFDSIEDFTAEYNGEVRVRIDCFSRDSCSSPSTMEGLHVSIYEYEAGISNHLVSYIFAIEQGTNLLLTDKFNVYAGKGYAISISNKGVGQASNSLPLNITNISVEAKIIPQGISDFIK